MLKLNYFLADIFILSAEKQPIKLSWRKIEWLLYFMIIYVINAHEWYSTIPTILAIGLFIFFILKDEPELKYNAAIEKSMSMMNGYKMKLFLLDLSFIGWMILSVLTLGIGLLFLQPYMSTARAAFYEDLKAELSGRNASEEV